ncbi:MAG: hypothetical protein ACI90V_009677 [Bacillariaceae sp.]|jgi:hypothetical protein
MVKTSVNVVPLSLVLVLRNITGVLLLYRSKTQTLVIAVVSWIYFLASANFYSRVDFNYFKFEFFFSCSKPVPFSP